MKKALPYLLTLMVSPVFGSYHKEPLLEEFKPFELSREYMSCECEKVDDFLMWWSIDEVLEDHDDVRALEERFGLNYPGFPLDHTLKFLKRNHRMIHEFYDALKKVQTKKSKY